MTVGAAFVIGIVVGRIMGDIAEWLRKRQAAKANLDFAKGYLMGIQSSELEKPT